MHLDHFLKTLRRRWKLPVVLAVFGFVVGWFLPGSEPADVHYYRATYTLNYDSSTAGTSLENAAVRATTGTVRDRTADALNLSKQEILGQLDALARAVEGTLQITAISTDPKQAVRLADTDAEQFLALQRERSQAAIEAERNGTEGELARLERARTALEERISDLDPSATGTLQSQLTELEQGIEEANAKVDGLAGKSPSPAFETLESATPVEITGAEFNERFRLAAEGPVDDTGVVKEAEQFGRPGGSGGVGAPIRAAAGMTIGAVLGVVLALLLDRLDRRLIDATEVEQAFRLPVIAEIPVFTREQRGTSEVLAALSPRSPVAEAYRLARQSILSVVAHARAEHGSAEQPLVVMITSSGPDEGKTTTTANLAAVFAELGSSVLVFNCDYRRPRLHEFFPLPSPGEQDEGEATAFDGARATATTIAGVRMVTGLGEGDSDVNPSVVVESQRRVIEVARRHFDVILLDTMPLLLTGDASELIDEAEVIVVVARSRQTTSDEAEASSQLLERLEAPALGVILTASEAAMVSKYYGKYGYYQDEPTAGPRADRKNQTVRS